MGSDELLQGFAVAIKVSKQLQSAHTVHSAHSVHKVQHSLLATFILHAD
jgi:hypothetical protein